MRPVGPVWPVAPLRLKLETPSQDTPFVIAQFRLSQRDMPDFGHYHVKSTSPHYTFPYHYQYKGCTMILSIASISLDVISSWLLTTYSYAISLQRGIIDTAFISLTIST